MRKYFLGLVTLCFSSLWMANAYAHNQAIPDEFETYDHVIEGLRDSGLDSSNLIIAFDFTGSNKRQGMSSYVPYYQHLSDPLAYQNLHYISPDWLNPYQQVIEAVTTILAPFDDDQIYPLYEFGSKNSKNKSVTDIKIDGRWPMGASQVMQCYNDYVFTNQMSGPTSFAPAVNRAVEIVKENDYEYHILLIITDGKVTGQSNLESTYRAISRATKYPLSIVIVGVGDGPFDDPDEMDDNVRGDFDNLQFVNFTQITKPLFTTSVSPEIFPQFKQHILCEFAKHALMEVPQQFNIILERDLLGTENHCERSRSSSYDLRTRRLEEPPRTNYRRGRRHSVAPNQYKDKSKKKKKRSKKSRFKKALGL